MKIVIEIPDEFLSSSQDKHVLGNIHKGPLPASPSLVIHNIAGRVAKVNIDPGSDHETEYTEARVNLEVIS